MIDPDLRELPGLQQWGDELRLATRRLEAEQDRRRRRRRVPVRRLGIAVAAMFVLVPGAVATRSIWDDPVQEVAPLAPQGSTPAVRLADGSVSGVSWRVGGYDAGTDERCLQFDTSGGVEPFSSRGCAAPITPAELTVQTSPGDRVGFVYGTTSSAVRSVEVTVPGGRRLRVETTGVSDDTLRRSRMRGGFRVFVASFAAGFDTPRPPQVTAFDGTGGVVATLGGP